jgi:hypothetical protein
VLRPWRIANSHALLDLLLWLQVNLVNIGIYDCHDAALEIINYHTLTHTTDTRYVHTHTHTRTHKHCKQSNGLVLFLVLSLTKGKRKGLDIVTVPIQL